VGGWARAPVGQRELEAALGDRAPADAARAGADEGGAARRTRGRAGGADQVREDVLNDMPFKRCPDEHVTLDVPLVPAPARAALLAGPAAEPVEPTSP
jgi:hypothetical protein